MLSDAHSLSVDEVVKYYQLNETHGLSKKQVESSLRKYGYNGLLTKLS